MLDQRGSDKAGDFLEFDGKALQGNAQWQGDASLDKQKGCSLGKQKVNQPLRCLPP